MDLKEFVYLTALAEEGSVSKAADRLFMAQSSLSQFLQQFEGELGVRLFIRTSKGIVPSPNGRLFISRLKKIMADYQRAKNELWDNENMKGGQISFGISSFRGRRMLPKILKRFYELYPDVRIDVVEEHSLKLEELLLEGTLDVGVIVLPAAKLKNEASFLKKEEVYIVASRYHPVMQYAKRREANNGYWIDLKDSVQYNFILSYHDTILGNIGRNLFREQKLKYHAIHDNISAEMAVSMAEEGLGLAFTYASCVAPNPNIELLRIGKEGFFINLGVAFPSREYHSLASQALESVIREVYAREAY